MNVLENAGRVERMHDFLYAFENAVQSGDIWKRSPIVLVWTAKTEAFENADVIHATNIAGASICRMRRWLL